MPYDALKDFVPIVMAVRAPLAVVVRGDSPYRTLADLVKQAAGQSKPPTYGAPGPGTTSHLIGLMLAQASKTSMQAVHYRGEAPMIQDLISGQVDFAASNIIRSHVEGGTLRVLATTGEKRWFAFPDAPTLKELGYPVEYYAWNGFVAPARNAARCHRAHQQVSQSCAGGARRHQGADGERIRNRRRRRRCVCQGDDRVYP